MIASTRWTLPRPTHPNAVPLDTALVRLAGTTSVMLSLPTAGVSAPWCVVDLFSGEIRRGAGMPGGLRAVLPVGTERPWVLASYGLGRLELEPRLRIADVVRKGIGKHLTFLHHVDDGLLGVGYRGGGSLLLVSTVDGTPVRRLRVQAPEVAYRLANGHLRVVGFLREEACDIDTTTWKVRKRYPLPIGLSAYHHDGQLFVIRGKLFRFGSGIEVLDAETLDSRHFVSMKVEQTPETIAGVDSAGRIVAGRRTGLMVLDLGSSTPVATFEVPMGRMTAVALLPEHDAAGLAWFDMDGNGSLYSVRW